MSVKPVVLPMSRKSGRRNARNGVKSTIVVISILPNTQFPRKGISPSLPGLPENLNVNLPTLPYHQ